MTFARSMLTILAGGAVRARLVCLAPLDARGAHRRELAEAARGAVAQALHRQAG
jgi:1-acyl-sn-glycerol-3-phosphate acyltransferase